MSFKDVDTYLHCEVLGFPNTRNVRQWHAFKFNPRLKFRLNDSWKYHYFLKFQPLNDHFTPSPLADITRKVKVMCQIGLWYLASFAGYRANTGRLADRQKTGGRPEIRDHVFGYLRVMKREKNQKSRSILFPHFMLRS